MQENHRSFSTLQFFCLFLLFVFQASLVANAQKSFKFRNLKSQNEDLNKAVTCICEDQYGYLWIGYDRGLDRYDGSSFTHFAINPFDPGSLANPMVRALLVDQSGRLWIGTQGGLFLFDYISESFKPIELDIENNQAIYIEKIGETIEDGKTVLWLSYLFKGLIKYYPDTGECVFLRHNTGDDQSICDSVFFDAIDFDESLWVGTYTQGLIRTNDHGQTFSTYKNDPANPASIPDNHILGIEPDTLQGRKVLWLATGSSGLVKMDIQSETFEKYTLAGSKNDGGKSYRILSICQYDQDILGGTLGEGLAVVDPSTQETVFYASANNPGDLNSNIITSLFVSKDNILWIGSFDNGVNFYDPFFSNFSTINYDETNPHSISENSVNVICEVKPGEIWIGTNDGINIINEKSLRVAHHDDVPGLARSVPKGITPTIHKSKLEENILWISSFADGLTRFDLTTQTGTKYRNDPRNPSSLSSNTITSISEGKDGFLWMAGNKTGLNRMDPRTGMVKRYITNPADSSSLNDNSIVSIYHDSDQTTWISTYSGLAKYNPENDSFIRYYFDEGRNIPAANLCTEIVEDSLDSNILWVGSAVGLLKLDKKSGDYLRFTNKDGLPANLIISVLSGTGSELWLATSNGICSFNTRDYSVRTFSEDDGILGTDFFFVSRTISESGQYYFGGGQGLTFFKPDSIKNFILDKKPLLTDFYLFNEKVPVIENSFLDTSLLLKNEITLRHKHSLFGIGFTATVFRKSADLKFEYMLNGFNSDWLSTSGESKIATFTNIPAGSYTFRVRLANNDNPEDQPYSALRIRILPPLWLTWWAKIIYALMAAAFIIGYIRWRTWQIKCENIRLEKVVNERTNELKIMNHQKDRFFSIVAHDLKSPFISLVKYTDIIAKRFAKLSDKEKLESIHDISISQKNSYKYLVNLLDWSRIQIGRFEYNPKSFDLTELIKEKICLCDVQAANKDIQLVHEGSDSLLVFADSEMISVVLTNLLTNAIKFSKRGDTVRIVASNQNNLAQVSIIDSGVGMDKDQLDKLFRIDVISRTEGTENEEGTGLGLILSKELIVKNNGDIQVESQPGIGSTFTFSLPLDDKTSKESQE